MIDLDCGFGGVKLNWEILTVWLFIGFCLILLLLNCEIIECLMAHLVWHELPTRLFVDSWRQIRNLICLNRNYLLHKESVLTIHTIIFM